jgi:hypothetical protein
VLLAGSELRDGYMFFAVDQFLGVRFLQSGGRA